MIGLLVLLRQIQIPFFLYYPNTTDTVLISGLLDHYVFLVTSLCVPRTLLAVRHTWKGKIRSVGLGISGLWFGGVLLIPITVYYGIPLIYLAVVTLALVTFRESSTAHERSEEGAYLILGSMSPIALIECAATYYWVTAAFSPQAMFGVAFPRKA